MPPRAPDSPIRGDSDWWRQAIFYEIYVRSFGDTNGDGVGDLRGIIEHLDYLNNGSPASLGVDALWITPINPSPMFDFGYDVSDYRSIDPLFGTLKDYDELITEAHKRGIRVLFDLVPNHTSHQHSWFVESRSSRDNRKRDWYIWRDPGPNGGPPNNWVASFGGAAWTLDPTTGQYYLHSFLAEQPDLNYRNPEVCAAIEDIIRFWLDRGVDGFRVDVVHKMVKDERLRDNPAPTPGEEHPIKHYGGQVHLFDEDQPEVHDIIRSWRRILDSYEDRMMVGEVYILDPARIVPYYGNGRDELSLSFNFSFLWTPWDASAFREQVEQIEQLLPADAQPTYVLSSHDAPRHRGRFDDDSCGEARARLAALMLLTLRGSPFLYYGEEIGMQNGFIPTERICDPLGKRFPPLNRDPERTPMQWSAGTSAGFSTNRQTWLPIVDDAQAVNVAAQHDDPASLLSFYRRAIWYRKSDKCLTEGAYRSLDSPAGTYVFERAYGNGTTIVALNFESQAHVVPLPVSTAKIELSTNPRRDTESSSGGRIELAPVEGVVIRAG